MSDYLQYKLSTTTLTKTIISYHTIENDAAYAKHLKILVTMTINSELCRRYEKRRKVTTSIEQMKLTTHLKKASNNVDHNDTNKDLNYTRRQMYRLMLPITHVKRG